MDMGHQQASQAHFKRLILKSLVVLANGRLWLLAVPVAVKGRRLVLELLPSSSLWNKRTKVVMSGTTARHAGGMGLPRHQIYSTRKCHSNNNWIPCRSLRLRISNHATANLICTLFSLCAACWKRSSMRSTGLEDCGGTKGEADLWSTRSGTLQEVPLVSARRGMRNMPPFALKFSFWVPCMEVHRDERQRFRRVRQTIAAYSRDE